MVALGLYYIWIFIAAFLSLVILFEKLLFYSDAVLNQLEQAAEMKQMITTSTQSSAQPEEINVR